MSPVNVWESLAESPNAVDPELKDVVIWVTDEETTYVSAVNVFSHAYGDVNKERTHAYIHTEKAGTFNVLVTGVRKDESSA